MKLKKIGLLLALFILTFASGFSAQVSTFVDTSKTDVKNIKIGSQVFFDVQILHSQNSQPILVEKTESENFSILNVKTKSIPKEEQILTDFNFVSAFFETGAQKIPAQEFQLYNATDTTYLYSDSLQIFVKSVLTEKDTTGIKDIFSPSSLVLGFWDIFIPILIIALIVLGIILITRYRKGKTIIPIKKKKIEPAHIIALRKLDKLKLEKLLSRGEIKEYYINVSWICREYLENRFNLPILESTSYEIKQLLREREVEERLSFVKILKDCDKVKYAKFLPSFSDSEPILEKLEDLIIKTKQIEQEQTEGEDDIS